MLRNAYLLGGLPLEGPGLTSVRASSLNQAHGLDHLLLGSVVIHGAGEALVEQPALLRLLSCD